MSALDHIPVSAFPVRDCVIFPLSDIFNEKSLINLARNRAGSISTAGLSYAERTGLVQDLGLIFSCSIALALDLKDMYSVVNNT